MTRTEHDAINALLGLVWVEAPVSGSEGTATVWRLMQQTKRIAAINYNTIKEDYFAAAFSYPTQHTRCPTLQEAMMWAERHVHAYYGVEHE